MKLEFVECGDEYFREYNIINIHGDTENENNNR